MAHDAEVVSRLGVSPWGGSEARRDQAEKWTISAPHTHPVVHALTSSIIDLISERNDGNHSSRSTCIGSSRDARIAGSRDARIDTVNTITPTPPSVTASVVETP